MKTKKKIGHVQSDESKYNFITVREVQVQSPEYNTLIVTFANLYVVCLFVHFCQGASRSYRSILQRKRSYIVINQYQLISLNVGYNLSCTLKTGPHVSPAASYELQFQLTLSLSLRFNSYFPGEPGLAGVY